MKRQLVYHPRYNIRIPGARLIHPFDGTKYAKALRLIQQRVPDIGARLLRPDEALSQERLAAFATPGYLDRLADKAFVCDAIEVGPLRYGPRWFIENRILEPMRWAAAGTALAARHAIEGAVVLNLGGGYHHASHDRGEGFCLYNDIGIAVGELRRAGLLGMGDRIGIIDLDAHHGNGNARTFLDDGAVVILDAYNAAVYPTDPETRARVDYPLPFQPVVEEGDYLSRVERELERFFLAERPRLLFYNAGSDPYHGDRLGGYRVSLEGLVRRDRMVIDAAVAADVPTVVMTAGGYSDDSWRIIGESFAGLLAA